MFDLNIRFQIAATCFYFIILFDYFRNRNLPLRSNKYFTWMMAFGGVNLCFDMATVYTITHLQEVAPWLNRLCHQLFIGSLLIMMISLFLYIEVLGHTQSQMNHIRHILSMLPGVLSFFVVIYGKLNYYVHGNVAYSYGMMAKTLYTVIAFYSVMIIIDTYRFHRTIKKEQRMAIRIGVLIWVCIAVIQGLNPRFLLSGLAVVLMILFIYLSFENPKENMDETIDCYNKHAFHRMLDEERQRNINLYIVSVVVDNFDRLQVAYGHEQGDLLLEKIGDQLNTTFDTFVYHYRSNVITIILKESMEDKMSLLESMRDFLNEPIDITSYNILAKSHIDIIDMSHYQKYGDGVYEMMNYMAEHAKDDADTCEIHSLDDALMKEARKYKTIEKVIEQATFNDGFQMVYQPIYDVTSGKFHSAEALIRLKDTSTVGFISPEVFIPIAEKRGLIMKIGRIVFEKVCQCIQAEGLKNLGIEYVEINLSRIQCIHPDLPKQLHRIMMEYDIDPSFVNLEITETAAVESGEMLHRNMQQLKRLGCSFSMDDFGTGYSNLSQMAEVSFDLIKLDKSLIWPYFYEKNEKSYAILSNVINMLNELQLRMVAEGVETVEMANELCQRGVTYLQGYCDSKPLSQKEFVEFLKAHN